MTGQFKKDLKRIQNNPKKIEHLRAVLTSLQETGVVPESYYPHKLTESTTIQCAVTYSDMKFAIFELSDMRADGGSSQRVVKGKPLTIPLIYSYLRN